MRELDTNDKVNVEKWGRERQLAGERLCKANNIYLKIIFLKASSFALCRKRHSLFLVTLTHAAQV